MFGMGARYVSGRTATGGASALAALLLYRLLGPEEAGRLQLVLAAGMTAGTIAGLGFFETLARYVPERGSAGAGLLRRALAANVLVAGGGAAIFLAARAGGVLLPAELRDAPFLFLTFTGSYTLFLTALGMLRGLGRLALIPWLDGLANVGGKGTAALLALAMAGYRPALAAHAGFQLAALLGALLLLRRELRTPAARFTPRESRFGAIILFGMVLQVLLATVDLYLLRILLGAKEVGIYAAGARFPLLVEQLVLAPIGVPLLYFFSHPEYRDLREEVVRRGTRLLGAALGLAALLLAWTAPVMVGVLLGEAYSESVDVVRIYAAHAMGVGLTAFFAPLYTSADRPEFAMAQGAVTVVLNVGLSLLLIPRFGPAGAAAAGAIAVVFTAWGASAFVHRRFGVDVRGPIVGVTLLFAGGLALCFTSWGWVGILLYAGLLLPTGLFRPSDLRFLRARRRDA